MYAWMYEVRRQHWLRLLTLHLLEKLTRDRYLFSCKVFCSVDSHPHMHDLTKFEGWTDKETLGIHRPSCWNDFYCKRCMGHKSCSFYHHWMFVVRQYKIYFWTSSLYDYWYEIVYRWLGPSIYFWLCTNPLCRRVWGGGYYSSVR